MANVSKATVQARDAQVIEGIKKDLQTVSNLPLVGSTYTPAALIQLLQSRIDSANAVTTAHANWIHAAQAYDALNTQVTQVVRGLRQYVINTFGDTSPMLADFGFVVRKATPLTAQQKATRAAKAKATREARGTMGKKQKKGIKGTVPAAPAVPATTPAAPTPPAASPASTGTSAPVAPAPAARAP